MPTQTTPLLGPPPAEVPLAAPPLVRVIAQVRFPVIASIEKSEFIAPFQEALRGTYPVLRPETSQQLLLGPGGVQDTRTSTIWRFRDAVDAWTVALAPDFVALETTRYSSRDDFLGRFRQVLEALEQHINPRLVDRLGLRYVDQVTGAPLTELPALLRPEVSGILASPVAEHARQSLTEQLFELPDEGGALRARWGLVPAGATVDPGAMPPLGVPSWILDLDAFAQSPESARMLDVDAIVAQARAFAERIYSVFRWAVNDEFLRRYGGTP